MSEDLLIDLISETVNALIPDRQNTGTNILEETDLFNKESNLESVTTISKKSLVHTGDTDSSDDEENKYYEDQKYNESGRHIKHFLEAESSTSTYKSPKLTTTWSAKPNREELVPKAKSEIVKQDVYTDPIFGLRIVNPLVSFTTLKERMIGRDAIPFSRIQKFVTGDVSDKNWVLAGIIVNKSCVKTTQKGSQFLIWTLSDLKDDIKTVSMFLFSNAYKELWKTIPGTVVGILNPSILDNKDGFKAQATLSVDNAQKVMILGLSKDFGTCKSVKKNGDICTAIVNLNRCEYCIFHIKQEYQKCSRRSELQSNFSGKGLFNLKKKFLNNNGFASNPARRNVQLEQKDKDRLQALDGITVNENRLCKAKNVTKKTASNLELGHKQRIKDLALLEKLGPCDAPTNFNASFSAEVTLETSKNIAISVISKLKTTTNDINYVKQPELLTKESTLQKTVAKGNTILKNVAMSVPQLTGTNRGIVDLNATTTCSQISRAKLNALKYIQKNGPLAKTDPNSIKPFFTSKKRNIEVAEVEEGIPKKQKVVESEYLSKRFKKMMEATSKRTDLLDKYDNEERDKYFDNLEMKEKMEEKMMNTYKVPCKAVRCLKCKYTNFSASQNCKDGKHPLRVFDAIKRFFKCEICQSRTVSLEIVPTRACKNCGGAKWARTGMMKDKIVVATPTLSIRGGEQKFINSIASDKNLDLLVCRKFNEVGSRMLSRGFIQLEKRHAAIYKRVKSLLPRRESERRVHPLSRHCNILQAVETRISMLNMTYMKYIENNLLCFIPGKVLDEMIHILRFVESDCTPPQTSLQLLQEMRDLSSMAMEHFDEHILPRVREHKEQMDERRQALIASFTGSPANLKQAKPFIVKQVNDLQKIKKQYKSYKHHIAYLNQNTQKMMLKMKRQNKRLKAQCVKIRDQERKIQEQSNKIQEQETTITEIKKHMEEWDQKYKDLTTELVRARDLILLHTSPSSKSSSTIIPSTSSSPKLFKPNPRPRVQRSSIIPSTSSSAKLFKPNARPRVSRLLFRNYGTLQIDLERKRKSNLLPDIPVKVHRTHENEEENSSNIDKLMPLKDPDKLSTDDGADKYSFSIEELIASPLTAITSRKRKNTEELDLK